MTKEDVATTYNKIFKNWNEKIWVKSSEFNQKIVAFANITGNENALDVGIGIGNLEEFLKPKSVTGIDISEQMLKECRKKHPEFNLRVADAEKMPFPDETFDFVYCRNLLQNFEDPTTAFSEMYRVLRKGGKIMVIESAVYDDERQYVTDMVRVVEPHHALFPSHEQLRNLFDKFKLNQVEQQVVGLHSKWLSGFCKSKQASAEQRAEIITTCKTFPEAYIRKYNMKFHPTQESMGEKVEDVEEIESTLTFAFLKGMK